ncbi:TIGR02444 family protein [Rhodovibrio sodomensis]|uniref:TIGR02444 family protein n=1 Tax=Rhodovibrio sodomensis TaxID=1088 RepID=A0ABS1DCP6_9PROT|nr:TIGR02444 family protein [Rhodovibrio sodomensis]MBK1667907.1 TIGR02444 family protein [Rhodovibrio sodomensis]
MDARLDTPFWQFSLALYGRPGVDSACLSLQDRHGLDVNLLLLCTWAGHAGFRLSRADIAELTDRVADWQQSVVQPLRAVRQWLKQQDAAPAAPAELLRSSVKDQELAAEQLQQAILYEPLEAGALGQGARPGPRLAMTNLSAYFAWLSREPGVADAADLAQILTAAFGETLRPLDAIWQMQEGRDALPA